MARIRTIKPGFFLNEDVAALPAMVRLLWIGLWTQADREGRLEERPKRLKAALFPYDNIDIEKGLQQLSDAGFILRYKANANGSARILAPEQPVTEAAYIQVINFLEHQQPNMKEQESTIPAPCNYHASTTGTGKGNGTGKEGEGDSPPPQRKVFIKPDLEQLTDFFTKKVEEKKLGWSPAKIKEKAETFLNHYNSNGWMVGKAAMKDWQAAISNTWIKEKIYQDGNFSGNKKTQSPVPGNFDNGTFGQL